MIDARKILRQVVMELTRHTENKFQRVDPASRHPEATNIWVEHYKAGGHGKKHKHAVDVWLFDGDPDFKGLNRPEFAKKPMLWVELDSEVGDGSSAWDVGVLMKMLKKYGRVSIRRWPKKPENPTDYVMFEVVLNDAELPAVKTESKVNRNMRKSFNEYVTEAKKRASLDVDKIGVVDVGSAIDEHRHLARRLAVINALAKKMAHRVTELEALVLPIVKETEAQQLTIGSAIIKFGTRKHTSVAYKAAFEKALEAVNEETAQKLKDFLETVTHRDTKEFVEMVDTEVSAVLDKVKAAEKSGDMETLEKLMKEIMGLSNRIKEGRFTDHVVKAFGWTHLSHTFSSLLSKFRGLRKKIDWLDHVAGNPEKFGG